MSERTWHGEARARLAMAGNRFVVASDLHLVEMALAERDKLVTARPLDEWHEDFGPVLWWFFPIGEPPYAGTPLDSDWPGDHLTHWTPITVPDAPV